MQEAPAPGDWGGCFSVDLNPGRSGLAQYYGRIVEETLPSVSLKIDVGVARLTSAEVQFTPGDLEDFVATFAAHGGRLLVERRTRAAVRAHPVFGHPRKAGRVLGTRHDRPSTWRRAHDLEERPRYVYRLAHYVEHGLERTKLGHAIPGATA